MDNIKSLVTEEISDIESCFYNLIKNDGCIFDDLSDFIQGKSKRIRSLICLLYLKAVNVKIDNNIINLLAAAELIHNASLLHDDVIDNSHIRRGISTMYDKYGVKISVLAGDYLLSAAVKKLLAINNNEILNIFLKTTEEMSEAEIVQLSNRGQNHTIEQYLNIAKGKTASLFSACLTSAAILSGVNTQTAADFAEKFGILFQINNDMQPESHKNDKENGLKTAVDILGIEKTLALKDNYKEELRKILKNIPESIYKQGIEDLIKLL